MRHRQRSRVFRCDAKSRHRTPHSRFQADSASNANRGTGWHPSPRSPRSLQSHRFQPCRPLLPRRLRRCQRYFEHCHPCRRRFARRYSSRRALRPPLPRSSHPTRQTWYRRSHRSSLSRNNRQQPRLRQSRPEQLQAEQKALSRGLHKALHVPIERTSCSRWHAGLTWTSKDCILGVCHR